MEYRIEHDSMGEVKVPADKLWAAQTQRSHENFEIGVGIETMPREIIHAFGVLKKAAAITNHALRPEKMTEEKLGAISAACDEIMAGKLNDNFPLVVWQTGSGTQSNMNSNEVIANRGNQILGKKLLHPNDDANMSQSSNDTFPTAMHIAAVLALEDKLIPAVNELIATFKRLEEENQGIVKSGRTHLQDATPITFSQEISGWRSSLEKDVELIRRSIEPLYELALGGTAVGTGLNAPPAFAETVASEVGKITGKPFVTAANKFHALTSKDELVFAHGAIKALACDMLKIANDVRWLASGPRDGLGEIFIPENEPGSSIMPGKVNPVIPEVMNQICYKVIGNDLCVAMSSEAAQMELNAMEPVMAQCCFESAAIMMNGFDTLRINCVDGIIANVEQCDKYIHSSFGVVTALNPVIGYKYSTRIVKEAMATGKSIYDLVLEHDILSKEDLDTILSPENMIKHVKLDIKVKE